MFQSPSRGGHLRGSCAQGLPPMATPFQSPSRGGHLRGYEWLRDMRDKFGVSVPFTRGTPPWLSVRDGGIFSLGVSVPFTRGTPPWLKRWTRCKQTTPRVSVPFTRGTPPWSGRANISSCDHSSVSVPFTRGTPPWCQLGPMLPATAFKFQSPSRGGHLRGVD